MHARVKTARTYFPRSSSLLQIFHAFSTVGVKVNLEGCDVCQRSSRAGKEKKSGERISDFEGAARRERTEFIAADMTARILALRAIKLTPERSRLVAPPFPRHFWSLRGFHFRRLQLRHSDSLILPNNHHSASERNHKTLDTCF